MARARRLRGGAGDAHAFADAQRELAAVYDLKGDREAAFGARRIAAEAYAANGCPAEAAVELVRGGLALALEHDLTGVAAELYQRLSVTLYDSADYRRAEEALDTALQLCQASPDAGTEVACVTCMAYVLRERGEWSRAAELCRELIAQRTALFVAEGLLRAIHAFEGKVSSARRLLASSLATASRVSHYNMTVDTTSALARVAAAEGADEEAGERCRAVLARWEESDDHHYAVGGIRWAAGFFAARGDRDGAHACAAALTGIASATGHADALAALAHAIAETALLEGDPEAAADQLSRAVELHRGLDLPFAGAEIELRRRRTGRRGRAGARARAPPRRRPNRAQAGRQAAGVGDRARARHPRRLRPQPPRPPRRRGHRQRRAVAARARGHAPAVSRPHEPRDRPGPVPQHPPSRHARAQHLAQARLPPARRGRGARARAGFERLTRLGVDRLWQRPRTHQRPTRSWRHARQQCCIGGHRVSLYEQNTQQSPSSGRSVSPQAGHR